MRHRESHAHFYGPNFRISFSHFGLILAYNSQFIGLRFAISHFMDRQSYIKILKQEFLSRRAADYSYSMRNFAKDLNLNHVHLSYILNDQRGLSRKKAELVARKLTHLNIQQRQEFLLTVSSVSARSRFARNLAKMGLKNNASGLQKRFNLIAQNKIAD